MILYTGNNETDKHKALIKTSSDTGAKIVAVNWKLMAIKNLANTLKLVIPEPISYQTMLTTFEMNGASNRNYIIDDVDRFLNFMMKGKVVAASMITGENWSSVEALDAKCTGKCPFFKPEHDGIKAHCIWFSERLTGEDDEKCKVCKGVPEKFRTKLNNTKEEANEEWFDCF